MSFAWAFSAADDCSDDCALLLSSILAYYLCSQSAIFHMDQNSWTLKRRPPPDLHTLRCLLPDFSLMCAKSRGQHSATTSALKFVQGPPPPFCHLFENPVIFATRESSASWPGSGCAKSRGHPSANYLKNMTWLQPPSLVRNCANCATPRGHPSSTYLKRRT